MGVLGAIAGAIAGAVATAATAVVSAVVSVITWVVGIIGEIISVIGAVIGEVVGAVVEAATAVYEFLSGAVSAITGTVAGDYAVVAGETISTASMYGYYVGSMAVYYWGAISAYVSTIYSVASSLYNTLHLSTVMKVHNIAYLVSDDYRSTVNKIYDEIGEVSRVLGYGSEFLGLVIRDARNVVLDVSAIAGRKYDLGEVAWLQELNRYFNKFAATAEKYRANPGQVFWDVDHWLVKPNIDTKASIMQAIYVNLMNVTEALEGTVQFVSKLRDDVSKLIEDLPEFIRKEVEPIIGPIIAGFDEFISDTYKPTMATFNSVMATLNEQQKRATTSVDGLIDRLKRPGDYLSEIDRLPKAERDRQVKKVADIATEPYVQQAREVSESMRPRIYRLAKITAALKREFPPVEWAAGELTTPSRPAKTPVAPRETWFVGDY